MLKFVFSTRLIWFLILTALSIVLYHFPRAIRYPFDVHEKTTRYINQNIDEILVIYYELFNESKKCGVDSFKEYDSLYARPNKCQQQIGIRIFQQLPNIHTSDDNYASTFFVKLKDKNTLELLFLSGKMVTVQSPCLTCYNPAGIKQVIKMLQGKRPFLPSNWETNIKMVQDSLAHGNLLHFFADGGIVYFGYGEWEIIIPVVKNRQIIGAVVRIYGD